jgi:DNA-directed RNA polymerase
MIIRVAENPLDDSEAFRFWSDKEVVDSPFQFLAFCFEYAAAVKSGNPETYVSNLPVGMDGSCNGPQHLAAMGRDEDAGRLVNLIPTDKPGDIYTKVAEEVARMVAADLNSKEEREVGEGERRKTIRTADEAALWHGKIDRKTVKRPTMTVTYGARRFGFRKQLTDELGKVPGLSYLVKQIDVALRRVVKQGFEVMGYLQDVAEAIAKADRREVEWRTPLGLPVIQEKLGDGKAKKIETYWGGTRVSMRLKRESKEISVPKMINGISPNFVHALDSTHLMMVVNRLAKREGVTSFMCVHDSFGTHAGNVDRLNVAIREEFVALYSIDRIAEWRDMVLENASEKAREAVMAIPMPEQGSLNLHQVLESRYFFA